MTSHHCAAALAAFAMAAPFAYGQAPDAPAPQESPAPDPLCAGITHVVKTAGEERPFISLVPANQSLGSLPKLNRSPDGFADFKSCQLYRAGNAKAGVNGGGPYNYVRCNMFNAYVSEEPADKAAAARAAAQAAYDALAPRAKACLGPAGWTVAGGARERKYEDYDTTLTFTQAGNVNDVVVSMTEDNSSPGSCSRSTNWSVNLTVRNPNPGHPKPQ
jgi:hypothetical protein